MAESRRNAHLKFQPVLYGSNFNPDGGAEAPSSVFEIPVRSSSKLDDSDRLLIDGLREGASRVEKTSIKNFLVTLARLRSHSSTAILT